MVKVRNLLICGGREVCLSSTVGEREKEVYEGDIYELIIDYKGMS